MYIAGMHASEPQTARSRELSGRIEEAIRDFQRDHPELTRREIYAALSHSMALAGHDAFQRRRVVALSVGVAAAGVGAMTALSSGVSLEGSNIAWIVVSVVAGLGGLAIALRRMTNR